MTHENFNIAVSKTEGIVKNRCYNYRKYHIFFTSLIVFFLISSRLHAQNIINIVEKPISQLPFYDKITNFDSTNQSQVLKARFQYLDSVKIELMYYYSDGFKVKGFIITPKEKTNCPVIIFNRGGNRSHGMTDLNRIATVLAELSSQGYIVIGSQYRGSFGSEGKDEFGGSEVNDILNLFPIINRLPAADTSKIGLLGFSRGAIMNLLTAKKHHNLKTVVCISGKYDLTKIDRPEMKNLLRELIPNYEKDSLNLLKRRSAVYFVDSLPKHTKYFFLHGAEDERASYMGALELYELMLIQDFDARLMIFEGADHSLNGVKNEFKINLYLWLDKYLRH